MSNYTLHNLLFIGDPRADFDGVQEPDKPVRVYPEHYLAKLIGPRGNTLKLWRGRQGKGEVPVPNRVLRNDGGIAVIRIHNVEHVMLTRLAEQDTERLNECPTDEETNYPFCYVVVDCRHGKCQLAIERSSNWGSETNTLRLCLEKCFDSYFQLHFDMRVEVREKMIATRCEQFIEHRIYECHDLPLSYTFEYRRAQQGEKEFNRRVPKLLSEPLRYLDMYFCSCGVKSGYTTNNVEEEEFQQTKALMMTVASFCSDNGYTFVMNFRDYGEYRCNEEIRARFQMNDQVILTYINRALPEQHTSAFDLEVWLDEVFHDVFQNSVVHATPKRRKARH